MRLVSSPTSALPPEWAKLADEVADYSVSTRWLETLGPLLPGQPWWLVAKTGGQARIGLHARWLESPPAEARYDIGAVLRGSIPALEPRRTPVDVPATEDLYPTVLVTLPGYCCAAAGSGASDPALLRETLNAIDGWAAARGARSVSFLYVPERQALLREALAGFGALPVDLYPTCVLPITFDSVAEYQQQLSQRRRSGLRRLVRRLADNGMTAAEVKLWDVRDEVLELRLGLLRKYHSDADRATLSATLDRMMDHYPAEDIVVTAVRRGHEVVGFTLALRHGGTLRPLWGGQTSEAYGAYFVMNFHVLIAAALERGIERIDYGTLKWTEKTRHGCRLESLTGHMWAVANDA
ncbi:GNAT family N-acetyltransferase [Nocardia sp. CDC160]|uniref:GNAT family N-acetyltransferase n=1 Tax=Nocardia sp. CDC160 TaxID=3112166 RepID=UPI002DBD4497|nr:GNAT family N-acetyltransferase [Nocardia sp. CDC160]MEC3920361.1 GNAT family N-acetyltransferase [Nocardia sp. CDC160]